MADQPVEPQLADGLRLISPYLPGFAGAVLALVLDDKTPLTLRGRCIKVAGGFLCAAFLGPAFAMALDIWWPGKGLPSEVFGAVVFATGLLSMRVLPPLMAWASKAAGDPLKLLPAIQIGQPAPSGRDVLVGDPSLPAPPASAPAQPPLAQAEE